MYIRNIRILYQDPSWGETLDVVITTHTCVPVDDSMVKWHALPLQKEVGGHGLMRMDVLRFCWGLVTLSSFQHLGNL